MTTFARPSRTPRQITRRDSRRRAFTLIEATVAILITSMACSALMLSLTSATTTTDDAVRRYMANGIAQTMLDEITGMRYMELGGSPYDSGLAAGSDEQSGTGRSIYDDLDDYSTITNQPPKDRNGQTLGNENGDTTARDPNFRVSASTMARWSVQTECFYVNEGAFLTPLANTAGTNYRTIRVTVKFVPQTGSAITLSQLTRTFAYIPEP